MRIRTLVILAAIFGIAFALLGIGQCGYRELDAMQSLQKKEEKIRRDFPDIEHIDSRQVAGLLEKNKQSVLLIDCRTPEEYAVSRIPGAINLETVAEVKKTLSQQKTAPDTVIVYCSVGQRSAELTEALKKAGIPKVKNYVGSIFAWANEDRPLVTKDNQPAETVHPYNRFWGQLVKKERRAKIN